MPGVVVLNKWTSDIPDKTKLLSQHKKLLIDCVLHTQILICNRNLFHSAQDIKAWIDEASRERFLVTFALIYQDIIQRSQSRICVIWKIANVQKPVFISSISMSHVVTTQRKMCSRQIATVQPVLALYMGKLNYLFKLSSCCVAKPKG